MLPRVRNADCHYELLAERRVTRARRMPNLGRKDRGLWHLVDRRIAKDSSGNAITDDKDSQQLGNDQLYREIPGGPIYATVAFYHQISDYELDNSPEDTTFDFVTTDDGGEGDTVGFNCYYMPLTPKTTASSGPQAERASSSTATRGP